MSNLSLYTKRIIVLLIVIALPGCGGTGGDTPNTTITASGGTVYSPDRATSLAFPAGIVTKDTQVTIGAGAHASDLQYLDSTGLPAYSVQLSDSVTRSRAAVDPNSYVTFTTDLPSNADPKLGQVYISRAGFASSTVVDSAFDPATRKITARIPIAFLNENVTRSAQGRQAAPVGFTVINNLKIGVTVLTPTPGAAGPANITKMTYSGGTWSNDDWASVRNIGAEKLSGKRIAVVVHGTWSSVQNLPELSTFLANLPDKSNTSHKFFDAVIGVNYESIKASPDQNGDLLAAALKPLEQNGTRLFLFAHSQGGLVARWAIEKADAKDAVMLVMFGTPNQGIPAAAVWAAAKSMGSPPDSPALEAMKYNPILGTESAFLDRLNATTSSSNAAYYTVTGDITFDTATGIEAYTHEFLWDGPDDGVVYLRSARLQNLGGFTLFDRGAYTDSRNLTVPIQHTLLPAIQSGSAVESTVRDWIYQEGLGNSQLTIN